MGALEFKVLGLGLFWVVGFRGYTFKAPQTPGMNRFPDTTTRERFNFPNVAGL